MRRGIVLLLLALLVAGCTRAHYRRSADLETYSALAEHENEARWPVANTTIVPPPASRLFDPYDPDHPPMPPDDPTANQYMERPNGMRGSKHFHDHGDAPFIESPQWLTCLSLEENG